MQLKPLTTEGGEALVEKASKTGDRSSLDRKSGTVIWTVAVFGGVAGEREHPEKHIENATAASLIMNDAVCFC